MLGRLTHDVYCGFKLWRGDAAQAVFERVEVDGWVFDAEALAIALGLGYRVREVGIDWTNRPSSRLSIFDVLFPAVRELVSSRRAQRQAAAFRRESKGGFAPPAKLRAPGVYEASGSRSLRVARGGRSSAHRTR
jgi:hypothetical protein